VFVLTGCALGPRSAARTRTAGHPMTPRGSEPSVESCAARYAERNGGLEEEGVAGVKANERLAGGEYPLLRLHLKRMLRWNEIC
jgi:hypothetical protein